MMPSIITQRAASLIIRFPCPCKRQNSAHFRDDSDPQYKFTCGEASISIASLAEILQRTQKRRFPSHATVNTLKSLFHTAVPTTPLFSLLAKSFNPQRSSQVSLDNFSHLFPTLTSFPFSEADSP